MESYSFNWNKLDGNPGDGNASEFRDRLVVRVIIPERLRRTWANGTFVRLVDGDQKWRRGKGLGETGVEFREDNFRPSNNSGPRISWLVGSQSYERERLRKRARRGASCVAAENITPPLRGRIKTDA